MVLDLSFTVPPFVIRMFVLGLSHCCILQACNLYDVTGSHPEDNSPQNELYLNFTHISLYDVQRRLWTSDFWTDAGLSYDFGATVMGCFVWILGARVGMQWGEYFVTSKFICVNLKPKMLELKSEDLGRWLGHEDGTLMNGINALIKGDWESLFIFYPMETQWKDSHMWPRKWVVTRHRICHHLDLRLCSL